MDKQARDAREQMKALPFKEKWENFWFYYKKHVIIGIFVAVIVATSVVQCATRIKYDLNVSYYTSIGVFGEATEKLETMMKEVAADINNNEQVDVGIAINAADPNQMNEQTQAVTMKLMTEMAAGEAMGYMFDSSYKEIALKQNEELADTILEIGVIPEIRELFGLPENEKLYWCTKTLYESEKDDDKCIAQHENAVSVEKMFIEMGAEIVEQ